MTSVRRGTSLIAGVLVLMIAPAATSATRVPASATNDAVRIARDPLNPLALAATPPAGDPLRGAVAYVDWKRSPAAKWARRWRHRHPRAAGMLRVIAHEPSVARYGTWDGRRVGVRVARYLAQASRLEPGRVPELSTYNLSGHGCHHSFDPRSRVRTYHRWIRSLAVGIGAYRAILFLEQDAVMTFGCLNHKGRVERVHELRYAINVLSRLPHLVVYVDGGAADALSAGRTARILRDIGVSKIQGFYLNSTHFDWTKREIRYGYEISRMTGGKHFVVNTSENGQGPLKPPHPVRQGNEILCNPPGRGLGPKPTFQTGYPKVDAFAWIAYPGQSDGTCGRGAPKVGAFWAAWALQLVRRANFAVR
jgi:endoglucanase